MAKLWAVGNGRPTPVVDSGTVFYKQQPSAGAKAMFTPQEHQYPAVGQTDSNGRFELQTFESQDGAVPGQYKIAVTKFEVIDLSKWRNQRKLLSGWKVPRSCHKRIDCGSSTGRYNRFEA